MQYIDSEFWNITFHHIHVVTKSIMTLWAWLEALLWILQKQNKKKDMDQDDQKEVQKGKGIFNDIYRKGNT